MERMRKIRADLSPIDSAYRFSRNLGVDVYLGHGSFVSNDTIEVNGKRLRFAAAVIAVGATASIPPIKAKYQYPIDNVN